VRFFKFIAAKVLWNMASYIYLIKSSMYGIWNKIYQSYNVYFLDVDMWGSEWCQWRSWNQHGAFDRSALCQLIFWVTLQSVGGLLLFSTPSMIPCVAGVHQIRCLFSLTKHFFFAYYSIWWMSVRTCLKKSNSMYQPYIVRFIWHVHHSQDGYSSILSGFWQLYSLFELA
jgi:hypothetical protein